MPILLQKSPMGGAIAPWRRVRALVALAPLKRNSLASGSTTFKRGAGRSAGIRVDSILTFSHAREVVGEMSLRVVPGFGLRKPAPGFRYAFSWLPKVSGDPAGGRTR
jgi:hypothetical protein